MFSSHLRKIGKSFSVVAILLLCGCFSKVSTHGYLPKKAIKIDTDKAMLRQVYGVPVFTDGDTWYYIEIKNIINKLGINKKYSARILKVVFDSNNKVKSVETTQIDDLNAIKVTGKSDLNNDRFSINKKLIDLLGNLAPSL